MLCSDAHIAQLNGQWRNKAEATDVLSFPMEQDSGDGCPVRMLGDLVISLDTARRQAQERGCVQQASHALSPSCSGLPSSALCSACCEDHLLAMQAPGAQSQQLCRADMISWTTTLALCNMRRHSWSTCMQRGAVAHTQLGRPVE